MGIVLGMSSARSLRWRSQAPPSQFQERAAEQVAELRVLLEQFVRGLPAPANTATELQRLTGLDMKLCWKIIRVMNAPDSLAAAQFIPGPTNMRSIVQRMGSLGAPSELTDRITAASELFDRFVAEHAGDRRTFDSMVSEYAGPGSAEKATLRERRAAFRANSHVWGVQAEVLAMAMIQRPSESDPLKLDEIGLRGEYGVRRVRPAPAPLYQQSFSTRDRHGNEYSAGRRRPLSGDGAGVGLIPEFCSRPLPPVVVKQGEGGWSHATVLHSELGIQAAVDLAMGFRLSDMSPRYRGDETHGWAIVHVTKPIRVVVIDLILEAGTLPMMPRPFGFMSSGNTRMATPQSLWTESQLTEGEPVRHLGRGSRVLETANAPRYAEMVDWAIRDAGWNPSRFECWRLKVEYPVVLGSVGLVYEMVERPS